MKALGKHKPAASLLVVLNVTPSKSRQGAAGARVDPVRPVLPRAPQIARIVHRLLSATLGPPQPARQG